MIATIAEQAFLSDRSDHMETRLNDGLSMKYDEYWRKQPNMFKFDTNEKTSFYSFDVANRGYKRGGIKIYIKTVVPITVASWRKTGQQHTKKTVAVRVFLKVLSGNTKKFEDTFNEREWPQIKVFFTKRVEYSNELSVKTLRVIK